MCARRGAKATRISALVTRPSLTVHRTSTGRWLARRPPWWSVPDARPDFRTRTKRLGQRGGDRFLRSRAGPSVRGALSRRSVRDCRRTDDSLCAAVRLPAEVRAFETSALRPSLCGLGSRLSLRQRRPTCWHSIMSLVILPAAREAVGSIIGIKLLKKKSARGSNINFFSLRYKQTASAWLASRVRTITVAAQDEGPQYTHPFYSAQSGETNIAGAGFTGCARAPVSRSTLSSPLPARLG